VEGRNGVRLGGRGSREGESGRGNPGSLTSEAGGKRGVEKEGQRSRVSGIISAAGLAGKYIN